MKNKSNSFFHFLIFLIIIFCTIIINLFIQFKNMDLLYEDKVINKYNIEYSYPYFSDKKDFIINKYLNTLDKDKIDNTKYMVNYVGSYINVLFKLYKEDLIVGYHSLVFELDKEIEIERVVNNQKVLVEKLEAYLKLNKSKLTKEEVLNSKKSFLFKDTELEVYLTNYDEKNSISLAVINYQELKDYLAFPVRRDYNYQFMPEVITTTSSPIIPPKEDNNRKKVAFSFDDGPSKYTLELLDVFDEYNANATFFLVGYNIKIRNSDVLDMYNRGFEIGNHTIDHSRLTKFDCEKAGIKVNQNNDLYKNITNQDMLLFRPPYGAINNKVSPCINAPIILWSVDSRDWESRNTDEIVSLVLSEIEEGDIVLFHDLYPTTIDAIKLLLPILYDNNFEVVSVSELFDSKNIKLENGQTYKNAR